MDLLYRDIENVAAIMAECAAGMPRIMYQPDHPHGFSTAIYLAEVALCRALWDPTGAIAELKRATIPYPAALRLALTRRFF